MNIIKQVCNPAESHICHATPVDSERAQNGAAGLRPPRAHAWDKEPRGAPPRSCHEWDGTKSITTSLATATQKKL